MSTSVFEVGTLFIYTGFMDSRSNYELSILLLVDVNTNAIIAPSIGVLPKHIRRFVFLTADGNIVEFSDPRVWRTSWVFYGPNDDTAHPVQFTSGDV